MERQYASDLTDEQWRIIRGLLPPRAKTGRPPLDRRWVLNALFFVNRTGCQWRMLPADFPKKATCISIRLRSTVAVALCSPQGFYILLLRNKLMMRCLVSAVVFFALSVSGVGAGELVPIKGKGSYEFSFDPEEAILNPDCEDGLILEVLGTGGGNTSHMGRFTETSVTIYDTCTGSFFGTSTGTTANGDELYTKYTGQDQSSDPTTLVLVEGTYEGGTGRFEDATGFFNQQHLRFPTSETTSASTAEFQGFISSVGSTTGSAHSVPEPTSTSLALVCLLSLAPYVRCRRNGR